MGHLLMPLMQRLERLGLSRTLAITLIFAAIVIITIYPIIKLLPILAEEAENFQYYIPKIEKFIGATYVNLRNEVYQRTGLELGDKTLIDLVTYLKDGSRNLLMNLPQYLASLLEWMLLVPLFLFFYMKEVESVKRAILRLTPNSIFEKFYFLSHQFNNQLGGYIFAKIVEASIVGIIITTGLWIMEIRFAFLLGLIAMITNIIPYVGPILGLFPAILLALAEYGISSNFWAVIILYAIANVIDLALVFPILVSKIVDLHPLLVVASVILGSQLLGVVGMVISIPMVAAIKLIIHEIYLEIYPTGKE
ncbi:MAG: hypothetical protein A2451_04910 [Bdellovibrionales bacterium RIFOXYC2_FULL_39_8]|nr:MAG: hypothetical protein A2451_04910 [Bdellovibrionales bacterium RIFOXYC2_FULL_39_8]